MTQVSQTVNVSKTWSGDTSLLRGSIGFTIAGSDGSSRQYELTAATATVSGNAWTAQLTSELPKYDADGAVITYIISETTVPDNYIPSGSVTLEFGSGNTATAQFTNAYSLNSVAVSVTKIWQDGGDTSLRPASITVDVLNGSAVVDTITLTAPVGGGNIWTGVSAALPRYENSEEIQYSVSEAQVTGYAEPVIERTGDSFTITNTRSGDGTVTAYKVWTDNNGADGLRSDVTLTLTGDGQTYTQSGYTVTADTNVYAYVFNVPLFDGRGAPITYSVDEQAVPTGYVKFLDQGTLTVTNTINIDRYSSLTVNKNWELGAYGQRTDVQIRVTATIRPEHLSGCPSPNRFPPPPIR